MTKGQKLDLSSSVPIQFSADDDRKLRLVAKDGSELHFVGFSPTITTTPATPPSEDHQKAVVSIFIAFIVAARMLIEANGTATIGPQRPQVPIRSERILSLLAPPNRQEEVLGDFEEGMHHVAERHGPRWATIWYRWQVAFYGLGRALTLLSQFADAIGKLWKPT